MSVLRLFRRRRRDVPEQAPTRSELDRNMWPHDYVGPNANLIGPCRIKTTWAGGYIIRCRRDAGLYTVPKEHVRYWKHDPPAADA